MALGSAAVAHTLQQGPQPALAPVRLILVDEVDRLLAVSPFSLPYPASR
jgi:hypothetical protein